MSDISIFLSTMATFYLGTSISIDSNIRKNDLDDFSAIISYSHNTDVKPTSIAIDYTNGLLNQKTSEAMTKLDEIKGLSYNWNDNGAAPFSPKLIDKCRRIILNLAILPQIYPVANNSIQLEYYKADGALLEFNVFDDKITMFKKSAKAETGERKKESRLLGSEKEIQMEVESFYE